MLFNNLVSQSGGGTELTTIDVAVNPGESVIYPIPESATLICFCGSANGPSGAIYKRTEIRIVEVRNNLSYTMTITPSANALTIASKGTASYYMVSGIIAYK